MPKLSTKQEIMDYLGLDWRTILAEGFPVTKIGNRIFSHTDLIDDFIKQQVESNPLKNCVK